MTINKKSFLSEFLELEKKGLHHQFVKTYGFEVLEREKALGPESFNVAFQKFLETSSLSEPSEFTLCGTQEMTICECQEILDDMEGTICVVPDMVDAIGSTLTEGVEYEVIVLLSGCDQSGEILMEDFPMLVNGYDKNDFFISHKLVFDISLTLWHFINVCSFSNWSIKIKVQGI